ncbi:hypothetical protein SAMN05216480_10679 [Pustulibacterium marinum]|uniref:Uncharacterized protein n=1 Tax=Pustulibacterium marinum TaxID=1224947 RepID=A0A1I7GXT4_9FLAO|nr:hypothetical protein [Pustulibacterium marinum]SFU53243.1 hypothetical protein SAMN05216480_10679 [Pustulibacterium marinum]
MANKVYRIHQDGAQLEDWFVSGPLNDNIIDSINTDGGDGKKMPTSIPSPFARVDLVRTAFKSINNTNIDGNIKNGRAAVSDYHKLVSDALDIGQIFFNYNRHKKYLSLVQWDIEDSLNRLLDTHNKAHQHFGKTIKLFLNQDSSQYNFDVFDKIYILKYKHQIIGATSPRTLFFAAPDAPETDIFFGEDRMLDDKILPLYKREKNYIKYLYALSKSRIDQIGFNTLFPEFYNYLQITIDKIKEVDYNLFDELNILDCQKFLEDLEPVYFNNQDGQPIEIVRGIGVKQFKEDSKVIENNSDFVIKTTKHVHKYKPLVLPTGPFNKKLKYTTNDWNERTTVPFFDKTAIDNRILPDQGDQYPYLTQDDFLSNYIVKLPFDINSKDFLVVGANKFLIPLNKVFFQYFSVKDIIDQQLISCTERGLDSIEVNLKIPIKKGHITYSKLYNTKSKASLEPGTGKGIIIEKTLSVSVYPNIKSSSHPFTDVGMVDLNPENANPIKIHFYSDTISKQLPESKMNSIVRGKDPYLTMHTNTTEPFDALVINYGDVSNYLIPLREEVQETGGDSYKFAIDFGTTNTHIEFAIEGKGDANPFAIKPKEEQIALLFQPSSESLRTEAERTINTAQEDYLLQETIPYHFGKDQLVSIPFRSCLLQNQDISFSKPTYTFGHVNIGFDYEVNVLKNYLRPNNNLKWSNEIDNEKKLKHYIEELLLLCKTKVLKQKGDVKKTKVIWFYPVSMTPFHLQSLRNVWEESYQKIFGVSDCSFLKDYPESITPFYYYKNKEGIPVSDKPSVAIDIGGGTTDVMIYNNGKTELINSFRFAGNAIFGDGFNGNINANGFVKRFKNVIYKQLSDNDCKNELEILNTIFSEYQSSTDLINFFFSLKENKNLSSKNIQIDFDNILYKDNDFKIIFLLYYTAIFYHIAELMKLKGYPAPRNIVFSGTGSKTLNSLDKSSKISNIKKLAEEIFNHFDNNDNANINIKALGTPKEITCKGGIEIEKEKEVQQLDYKELIHVNVGNFSKPSVQTKSKSEGVKYKDLNDEYLKGIVKNTSNFYDLFEELYTKIGFQDQFGMSNKAMDTFKELRANDQLDFLKTGISQLSIDAQEEDEVAQTLFFYPIIGLLYNIAVALTEND